MKNETAIGLAAQCWCNPRTEDRTMDIDVAVVFSEMVKKVLDQDPEIMAMIDTLDAVSENKIPHGMSEAGEYADGEFVSGHS